jgi:outer membrane lipoprotein-sorting protein
VRAVLAVLLIAGAAHAQPAKPQPPSAATVLANVEATYRKAQGFTAKFAQTVTNDMTGKVSKPKLGTVEVAKPTKMRFDYTGTNKRFVYNGRDFWAIDPDGKIIRHAKTVGTSPLPAAVAFFTGAASLSKDFTVAFPGTASLVPGATVIELTPKQPNAAYAKILLVVNPATWEVARSKITDSSGNTNSYDFSSVDLAARPKASRFNFSPSELPGFAVEELKP